MVEKDTSTSPKTQGECAENVLFIYRNGRLCYFYSRLEELLLEVLLARHILEYQEVATIKAKFSHYDVESVV